MPLEHSWVFPLANGLHARPASHLEEVARTFACTITFCNDRNGRTANAKSVLGLVGTETRHGDSCRLVLDGADEAAAWTRLTAFLRDTFATCDEPLVIETPAAGGVTLPRSLLAAGLTRYHPGRPACRGIGAGRSLVLGAFALPPELLAARPTTPAEELQAVARAVEALQTELAQAQRGAALTEAAVLKAHLGLLRDPGLAGQIAERIGAGQTAAQAVAAAIEAQAEILRGAESAYLRERVLDLTDVGMQLLEKLCGALPALRVPPLEGPTVLIAESLTPGQFLALDRRQLRALVLAHSGQTSHTVILARSFNIPTLTGVANATTLVGAGAEVIVDANLGILIAEQTPAVRTWYAREQAKVTELTGRLQAGLGRPGATADGRKLEIAANISSAAEAEAAFAQGADGIGLFRTELLFMDRTTPPTEEEQFGLYAQAVRAAQGRPVIIRTLDVGGDKPVPFLKFPPEKNPFLGYRGVRFYGEQAPLVKTQLRALLRAAALGALKIMVPMVAEVEEVRLVKRLLGEARAELAAAGQSCGELAGFGVMLEVPAAVWQMAELAAEVDFFSVGTNDLAQYFFAADRENPKLAGLGGTLHPAFVRLLRQLVDSAQTHGRWIGLCGEMAGEPLAWPLLVGLGFDEISLAAPHIAAAKAAVAKLAVADCVELEKRVGQCATRAEVVQLLGAFRNQPQPMLAPELVVLDVDCQSKPEAIRALVDVLHLAGRTDRPEQLEEEIWRREETYSTGFGGGLAVPHCKSSCLTANTIAVLKSRRGVEWGALDGEPVQVAILLAIRADDHGKEHLKVLARLSRLVMRDEFRERLLGETDPAALTAFINEALQPS
ncbi:MAG: phosphoenolpyruvate--protein phosphotransferase [Opitutae bacterium]|nr:phosphoenolpyruvate--protein phosphotransferase [Opitutae bacterium]